MPTVATFAVWDLHGLTWEPRGHGDVSPSWSDLFISDVAATISVERLVQRVRRVGDIR